MPATAQFAFVCVGLSILQGLFNLRFINQETVGEAIPSIVFLCVVLALLFGMIYRCRWAWWAYILLAAVGFILFVMGFIVGFRPGGAGIVSIYLVAPIQLTPVRLFFQLAAIIFLLIPSSRAWFGRRP
jgi:hypothetical protein